MATTATAMPARPAGQRSGGAAAHTREVMRSEWCKFRSVRSTWWALAAALARSLGPRWSRLDPRLLSAATLLALGALIVLASGPLGGMVGLLACGVGLVPVRAGVRRIQLMASLLVPVLAGYLTA